MREGFFLLCCTLCIVLLIRSVDAAPVVMFEEPNVCLISKIKHSGFSLNTTIHLCFGFWLHVSSGIFIQKLLTKCKKCIPKYTQPL